MHLVGHRVQHQIAVAQGLAVCGAVAGPAQQRPQAGLELAQRERLDEVVVGADVQPLDAVVDGVARGQHQDRGAVPGLAQAPADLEAVELGHEDVQDDRVGRALGKHVQGLLAVLGEGDIVVVEPQRTLERPPHGRLVVNDQNARHGDNDRANA